MHFGTHWREALYEWLDEGCPPLAQVEVDHQTQTWPAERLLRRMLACSDIMPGDFYRDVVDLFDLTRSRKRPVGLSLAPCSRGSTTRRRP